MKIKKSPGLLTSIGIALIVIAVVLIGWFLLRGETTVTGEWDSNESTDSLTCNHGNIAYKFLSDDGAIGKIAKINATFNKDDKLSALSLLYKLVYSSNKDALASRNVNHANMNISFGKNNLGADAFSARYSVQDNILQMNLYAESKELNSATMKYFLLDGDVPDKYTESAIQSAYETMGFNCILNNKN